MPGIACKQQYESKENYKISHLNFKIVAFVQNDAVTLEVLEPCGLRHLQDVGSMLL
jgi:hypothetical protein